MTKLNDIRAAIAAKQDALAVIEAAGRPVDETLPRIGELLDALAAPYVDGITRVAGEVIAARAADPSLRSALNLSFNESGFAVGAIARLLRQQILGDIEAEVARQAKAAPSALTDVEQQGKAAALRAEIRTLERQEEMVIEAEEAVGNHVDRRQDADAVAVLGIPDGVCAEFGL